MSATQPVSLVGAGLLVAGIGVLIKYFGYVGLIAGFDPDEVTDEAALADFVGTRTLLVAALTVAIGAVEYAAPSDGTPWYWYVYGVLVLGLAAWMIVGARRYES